MQAQTALVNVRTWIHLNGDSGNDNFGRNANWSGGNEPNNSTTQGLFNTTNLDNPLINGNRTAGQLWFTSGANAITFEEHNNNRTLTFNASNGDGLVHEGNVTHIFDADIALGSNQTWYLNGASGGLEVNDDFNLSSFILTLDTVNAANSVLLSSTKGAIVGTGGITKIGLGTLNITGANTYSGATTLNGGTTVISNNTALGATSGDTTIGASGTLELQNNITIGAGESLANSGNLLNAQDDNTYTGVISGGGTTTVDGGSLTLNGTTANTYTGLTSVNNGTLTLAKTAGVSALAGNLTIGDGSGATSSAIVQLTNANQIADTSVVTIDSDGQFNLNGQNETIGSLAASSATANVVLGAGTLTTGGANTSTQYDGSISGTGGLTKAGAGTMLLNGANTFTGTTTVNAGTLAVDGNQTQNRLANNAAVTINNGGTFEIRGVNATSASNPAQITINTGGTLSVVTGASTYGGSTSHVHLGNLTLAGGDIDLSYSGSGSAYSGESIQLDGTVTVTADSTIQFGSGANAGNSGVALNGTTAFTVNPGVDLTISAELEDKDSGANGFSKAGTGSMTLSGANTYTGNTTVTGGTLKISADNNLGGTSSTLELNGGTLESTATTTLNSSRTFTIGASGGTVDVDSGTTLTYDGALAGSGTFTKNDTGTFISGGTGGNTHSGDIVVNAGVLEFAKTAYVNGINNNAAVTVASGATLRFNGGALLTQDTIGSLAGAGTVTNTGAANVNFIYSSDSTTEFSGVLTDTTNDLILIKQGAGTFTLSGNNSYDGATTISEGKIIAKSDTALGATSGDTTVASGATLELQNDITIASGESLANSGNLLNAQDDNTYSGVISGTGTTTVTGGSLTLTAANTYTGTTTVSGGTLFATNNASLGANTANAIVNTGGTIDLDGGVTITKTTGTLTLNSSGTSASTGALHAGGATGTSSQWIGDIALTGDSTISAADNLLTIGDGTGSGFTDTLNLNANTLTLHTPDAATVTPVYIPFPSYLFDPSNIVVNSIISGTGGIDKTGQGTATLISTNKNTFTGDTNITGGTLIVDGSGFFNSPVISSTNVTVGNSSSPGTADSVILQMGQLASAPAGNGFIGTFDSGTLTASTAMTIYEDGLFDMNGGSNALSGLTLQGGHVTGRNPGSSPLLTIAGDVTTLASAQTALIEQGEVGMSKNGFTFNIADGAASTDLQVDSILHNGIGFTASSTSTVNKTGTGKMVFTAANDYVGITQVQQGILNIQHNTALGQTSSPFGSTGNGTVVSSGAQLQIEGGLTVGKETLTLNGTGVSNTGALLNEADNNTFNGFILLDSDSRINANAGTTLDIANTSGVNAGILNGTSAGKNLTVGGSGDTIINGAIGSFVNTLTKDGTGTLTLAGFNGYAGATNVTSGIVKVTHDNGLSGTGAVVTSGAALQFAQDATNTDIDVIGIDATLNGTGISNGGAIQNLNGTNSYLGNITLGSDSRITADSGSSLTLNGAVTGAGNNLSAGGVGDTNYTGIISGTGTTMTKTDTGTVTLSGTAANTFTGGLNINEGTVNLNKTAGVNALAANSTVNLGDSSGAANTANLVVQANNQMADSTDLVLNSDGRLQMGTSEDAISQISGTGQIDLGASGKLIIGDDNSDSTFGGSITSTDINGTLEKNGSGTLELTSDISYAGTLEIGGGTLKLSDIDLTVGALVITADTTIDFSGASTLDVGTLSFLNTTLTLNIINWDKTIDFFYATNWTGATQDTTGVLPMNQVVFDGFLGDQTIWDSIDDQIYPTVPEPSTYGLILIAASSALVAFKRRRNRNKAKHANAS